MRTMSRTTSQLRDQYTASGGGAQFDAEGRISFIKRMKEGKKD
jgi:hypothetical protein